MENLMKNGSCHVMAGNKRLLIADVEEVQHIELTDFATKIVTMKSGCGFGAYSHSVTCRLAGTKRRYDRLLADMAKGRWIAKIVDNTDTVWLSGSIEEPLRLSFRHLGAAEASGEHLYEIKRERDMTEPLCATSL